MPSIAPPFDRTIALACTMRTLRARWLYVTCPCGTSQFRPVRLMLEQDPAGAAATLADVVVHIRCHACQGRPDALYLVEDARGPGPLSGSLEPGWSVLLHENLAPPVR